MLPLRAMMGEIGRLGFREGIREGPQLKRHVKRPSIHPFPPAIPSQQHRKQKVFFLDCV